LIKTRKKYEQIMTNPDHKLLTAEREQCVLELLRQRNVMSVAEIGEEIGVSPATVRRDLQSMHERKLLQRVRGGATLRPLNRAEPVFQNKQSQNTEAKQRIAEAALELIEDHDRIYLDGGSTVLMLARLLDQREDLTVVTNSLMAAAELMTSPHRLVLVGGEFRRLSRTLVGPLTAPIIDGIHVDKAFMGTIGFTLNEGMTTTDANEAFTKECVMKHANQVILLADSSKLGVPSFARSGGADNVDALITEAIDIEMKKDLEALGIEVIVTSSN
jgi:DeoR/GlpR family transcriptional regulator of sugar metabolism